MAQIMVDTDNEPIAGLMLLSRLMTDYASLRAAQDKAEQDRYSTLTVSAPTSGTITPGSTVTDGHRVIGMVPELAAAYAEHGQPEPDRMFHSGDPCVQCGTPHNKVAAGPCPGEPDPAKIFGKFEVPTGTQATNVVPLFPQPAMNLPGATGPATLVTAVPGNVTAASTIPVVPIAPMPVAPNANASTVDVDSQGIPWDARIHSSSKKQKGDGTWILRRGCDPALAQQVTAELIATRGVPVQIATPTTSVPVLPNTPVSLPPAVSAVPVFTPPSNAGIPGLSGGVPVPILGGGASLPIPGAPAHGLVPAGPVSPVVRFREMMTKITAALTSKAITQEQLTAAHQSLQLPQLQQAVLFPDKIPQIEAALGL